MLQVGTIVRTDQMEATLKAAERTMTDLRPAFARIDSDVSSQMVDQWATAGAHFGEPWRPLAASTIKGRTRQQDGKTVNASGRARGGFTTPLWDTGGMRASFVSPINPWAVRVMDALTYLRGSMYAPGGLPLPLIHQEGKGVPKRSIIPEQLPLPVVSTWTGLLQDYLAERLS